MTSGLQARRWLAGDYGDLDVLELREVDVPPPGPDEVTIAVTAAGVNPADYKQIAGGDRGRLPLPIGYEVAGRLVALGPDTEIASGGGAVGDEVLASGHPGGKLALLP